MDKITYITFDVPVITCLHTFNVPLEPALGPALVVAVWTLMLKVGVHVWVEVELRWIWQYLQLLQYVENRALTGNS